MIPSRLKGIGMNVVLLMLLAATLVAQESLGDKANRPGQTGQKHGGDEAKPMVQSQEEPDKSWFVDLIIADAMRNPIKVRRSLKFDPRLQPSIGILKRQLQRSREELMAIARPPVVVGGGTSSAKSRAKEAETTEEAEAELRKRLDAVEKLAVLAGMTNDRELRELVIGLLGDRNRDVRRIAALGILQFEDQAESSVPGLIRLLEEDSTYQFSLLALTRVDPWAKRSYRGILRIIGDKSHVGPALWINALARFRWDEKTPLDQQREVLRFLDRLAGDRGASGSNTAQRVAGEIRGRLGSTSR